MKRVCGIVAVVALSVSGCMNPAEAKKKLDEAHKLWDDGKKAEAVEKYEEVINHQLQVIGPTDRPKVFQRVIEWRVERGPELLAKVAIGKALDNDISLDLTDPKAQELLARVKRDREKKPDPVAAKQPDSPPAKAEGGVAAPATAASGKKLAAFQAVVGGWEGYMGARGGSDEGFLMWYGMMEERQKAFFAVPFDPAASEDEARAMYDLYRERLTKIGELMKTLSVTGGAETAAEEAAWRRLTAHLTPIFKVVAEKE